MTSGLTDRDTVSFTGSASYEHATKIMADGYKDTLKKIVTEPVNVTHTQEVRRPRQMVGIVGYTPHVPNAIAGIPTSMITQEMQPMRQKVIKIKYSLGLMAKEDKEGFVKAGANLLSLIKSLELKGYRVALDLLKITFTPDRSEVSVFTINLKDWRQQPNPLKLTYPLTHPSFYRRHCFRHLETSPLITKYAWFEGHGAPIHAAYKTLAGQRQFVKSNGLLGENEYYIDTQTAAKLSPAQLITEMDIR
jgi:hypothetical protein